MDSFKAVKPCTSHQNVYTYMLDSGRLQPPDLGYRPIITRYVIIATPIVKSVYKH